MCVYYFMYFSLSLCNFCLHLKKVSFFFSGDILVEYITSLADLSCITLFPRPWSVLSYLQVREQQRHNVSQIQYLGIVAVSPNQKKKPLPPPHCLLARLPFLQTSTNRAFSRTPSPTLFTLPNRASESASMSRTRRSGSTRPSASGCESPSSAVGAKVSK